MKQRLSIASALIGSPDVLVLDEPTNGLDPEGIRDIRDLLPRLVAVGCTILIATHVLSEAERLCTHVSVMKHGRITAAGRLADLLGSAPGSSAPTGSLEDLFLKITAKNRHDGR